MHETSNKKRRIARAAKVLIIAAVALPLAFFAKRTAERKIWQCVHLYGRLEEAAAGDWWAQAWLGKRYERGRFLKNPATSATLYQRAFESASKAAGQGNMKALLYLVDCHRDGVNGAEKDDAKVFELYENAVALFELDWQKYPLWILWEAIIFAHDYRDVEMADARADALIAKCASLGHQRGYIPKFLIRRGCIPTALAQEFRDSIQ